MARLSVVDVKHRSKAAWKRKNNWRSLMQSAMEMAMPQRNTYDSPTEGQRKGSNLFDATLQLSLVRFANRLQAELTPAFQEWAQYVPGPLVPDERRTRARAELQGLTKATFAAIQVSNFDTAVGEFYMDLGLGTGYMMVLEGNIKQPVNYVTVPESECAPQEGPWGTIDGVYRQRKMPRHQIKQHWPDAEVSEPAGMTDDDRRKDVSVIEATYYDYDAGVWYYDVMIDSGDNKAGPDPERVVERTYDESPWIVTRWIKVTGEVQGRGPVLFALPDAKTANKVKELILRNAALAVSGVWTAVKDGVLNTAAIRIQPGMVIPVGRNGGALGPSLQPLEFGGRFDVAQLVLEDLQMSIKKAMLDNQLPPDDQGYQATATFIVARMKELQQDIGSPFGRIMSEFIRPLMRKTLHILNRIGAVNVPKNLLDGAFVDVQVTSPLAMVQNLNDVDVAVRWQQIIASMGQEAMMLGMKIEDAPEWFAEKMGVDTALVRDKTERSNMQQMFGQMMAQQGNVVPGQFRQGQTVPPGGQQPPTRLAA